MSFLSRAHPTSSPLNRRIRRSVSGVKPEMRKALVWAGAVSLVAWASLQTVAPGPKLPWTPSMVAASTAMDSVVSALGRYCQNEGIALDAVDDPNRTCLIGPEISPLFTTLGQLEAKRTSTNPDFAGLITRLLVEAGVEAGDRVAVGASGSFPGLLVAALSAVEALGGEPLTVLSLGASSFGATRPEFQLLDLYRFMEEGGWVSRPPTAVSLGGSGDVGEGFDSNLREALVQQIQTEGVLFLEEPDLGANVAKRMALYGEVAAFINIGGAEANLGTSPKILGVAPGLSHDLDLPPQDQRGVLFEMSARGAPVVHLLHVQGLTLRYGLQWDPIPLPIPGETRLRDSRNEKGLLFWIMTTGYFFALAVIVRRWAVR